MVNQASFDLRGRVAIVTGAGRGLGRALSLGLAAHGAAVATCDIDAATASESAELIVADGGRAMACQCDVGDAASCDAMVRAVLDQFGRVEILVNNAGIDIVEPVGAVQAASWDRVVRVDLAGVLNASQSVIRAMRARGGGGSIISISSIASEAAIPGLAAYSAAKSGVNQLTRVMALELAGENIRVNAIAPGYLENIMTGLTTEHENPATIRRIRERTPMGRRARLDELVGPVVFLASDASSYVTGAILFVDGGYSAA